jgi:chitinase
MIHQVKNGLLWIGLWGSWAYGEAPVIGAYYENYSQYYSPVGQRPPFSLELIDTDIITDLYYAFACIGYITKSVDPANPRLTGDFSIQPMEGNDQSVLYPKILNLKQQSKKGLRLFLTLGGSNFNDPQDVQGMGQFTHRLFSQMVSTKAGRAQFINSARDYAHRYGFDGIDVDWEYPGDKTRGGLPDDLNNFLEFLKECSTVFLNASPRLYLSYTAPAYPPEGLEQNFQKDLGGFFRWVAQCAPYVDRINVMAYDYHGPFANPKITGVNAPLKRDSSPQSPYFIAKTLENYLSHGVPANKIVLGIPVFGRSYAGVAASGPGQAFSAVGSPGPSTRQPGLLAYYEIADLITNQLLVFGVDQITSTVYGYSHQNQQWVSFDSPETVRIKAQMAKEKHLKGVVLWAVDMDEYYWEPKYPNLRSAWDVFHGFLDQN